VVMEAAAPVLPVDQDSSQFPESGNLEITHRRHHVAPGRARTTAVARTRPRWVPAGRIRTPRAPELGGIGPGGICITAVESVAGGRAVTTSCRGAWWREQAAAEAVDRHADRQRDGAEWRTIKTLSTSGP
jgi:hypothetical protein